VLTENAGHEIDGPNCRHENARHEIVGHENTGHEFARHDKIRMKIDYNTLECTFPLNCKSFVCKASVLT